MIVRIEYAGGPWDGTRREQPTTPIRDPHGTWIDPDGRTWHYVYRFNGRYSVGPDDGVTRRLYELAAAWPADTTHPSPQTGDAT